MPKPKPFQIGERIRILTSNVVRRVGYPLHPADPALRTEVINLLQKVDATQLGFRDMRLTTIPEQLINGLCESLVAHRGFGGKERRLHYYNIIPEPGDDFTELRESINPFNPRVEAVYDPQGKITTVKGKKVVHTGDRVGPSGGYDSYNMEYYSEPGYLENRKTHVLLRTSWGWIEACNVERVGDLL